MTMPVKWPTFVFVVLPLMPPFAIAAINVIDPSAVNPEGFDRFLVFFGGLPLVSGLIHAYRLGAEARGWPGRGVARFLAAALIAPVLLYTYASIFMFAVVLTAARITGGSFGAFM